MIKAIIFDLDNTLVDFMKMKRMAIDAAIAAMIDAGLKMTKKEAEEKINLIYNERGIEFQKVFDVFLEEVFGRVDNKILAAGIVAYRRAREAALVPYPHVHQTLLTLFRKGYKLGVVSDAPSKEAWLRLAYLNLHHIFDAVVTFEDTHARKPDAAPFLKTLELLNVNGHESVMVGDWPERDMEGARKLGMKTVFARYGFAFEGMPLPDEKSFDLVIDDIGEIIPLLNL